LAFVRPAPAQDELKHVSAHLANEVIPLSSSATTVGGFLDELSISLPEGTWIDPPLDAALHDGMSVFLKDLVVTRGTTQQVVPAETEISESWHYGPEQIELADPGQKGIVESTCTLFFLNGQEVGRRQQDRVIQPALPRQVVYYYPLTSEDGPSADQILAMRARPGTHNQPPLRYRKIMTMEATAYEPGPESCGIYASGNTSCGYEAGYGVVAVDPDVIPLHTRLYIEGYGYAIAGDVGSAIDGNEIDVGMRTVDECYDWGRKEVTVYILY
jgi:3D (Asp-Asp-Asp) domain-containing protein